MSYEGDPVEFVLHMKTIDDDVNNIGDDEIPNPVDIFFRQAADDQIAKVPGGDGWNEQIGATLEKSVSEVPHKDGVELEKCGKQLWKWRYENGNLVGAELQDPDLPGGVMYFDGNGNEKAAA